MTASAPTPTDVTHQTLPLGRRERAKADKRARILTAARARLVDEGYDAMTMAAVATDADVAIGTVFQYAATKPELLMMVTADWWSRTVPTLVAAPPDVDPVVAVHALLRPVVDTSVVHPDTATAIAREILFGADGPHQREVVALVQQLEDAIAAVLRTHGSGDLAGAAARLVVSGGVMEIHRGRTGRDGTDSLQDRLTTIIAIALAGSRSTV